MIAIHLFPKNIRTPIILPYQWLNLTFNVIRSNLSTSSDSSSDSDSDSENPKNSNKKYKNIDYLNAAKIAQKKREIEKQLTKTAQLLTLTSGKDKEKILSGLLETISKIQKEDSNFLVKSNEKQNEIESEKKTKYVKQQSKEQNIESTDKKKHQKNDLFTNRMQQDQRKRTRHSDQQFETRVDVSEEPSIISMLKSSKKRAEAASALEEPSLIRKLQNEYKLKQRNERKKEQFATKTLVSLQEEVKRIDNELQAKQAVKSEQSVIRMLKHQHLKNKNMTMNKIIIEWDKEHVVLDRIFDNEFLDSPNVPEFKMWNLCEEKELQSQITHFPENAFQQMIEWTNQGKLWKFPIDNEQGMEKEHNVHFSEHVFLERHLSPWCPAKGPIRHFMELVCVGLSKNPYMTFEEKYDHVIWYKDYFSGKQDLLQKLGLEIK